MAIEPLLDIGRLAEYDSFVLIWKFVLEDVKFRPTKEQRLRSNILRGEHQTVARNPSDSGKHPLTESLSENSRLLASPSCFISSSAPLVLR
jgi:hypothetical protein